MNQSNYNPFFAPQSNPNSNACMSFRNGTTYPSPTEHVVQRESKAYSNDLIQTVNPVSKHIVWYQNNNPLSKLTEYRKQAYEESVKAPIYSSVPDEVRTRCLKGSDYRNSNVLQMSTKNNFNYSHLDDSFIRSDKHSSESFHGVTVNSSYHPTTSSYYPVNTCHNESGYVSARNSFGLNTARVSMFEPSHKETPETYISSSVNSTIKAKSPEQSTLQSYPHQILIDFSKENQSKHRMSK